MRRGARKLREKGAQHRRPGRTARRARQERALDRLLESSLETQAARAAEVESLRHVMGRAT